MRPAFTSAALTILGAATLPLALAPVTAFAAPHKAASEGKVNHNGQVTITDNGSFTLGNPEAPVKVTEFISYTCPHCAELHSESDPILRTSVIPKGQVSVTISNLVRNPVDITIALLTACGDPKTFFVRHNAFFASQKTWLTKASKMSKTQLARWNEGTLAERLRTIAGDLGFYEKMEHFGVDRAQADQCLANKDQLDKVMAQYQQAMDYKFAGTPGIVLNGKVLYAKDTDGKPLLDEKGDPMQATRWQDLSKAITKALGQHIDGQA